VDGVPTRGRHVHAPGVRLRGAHANARAFAPAPRRRPSAAERLGRLDDLGRRVRALSAAAFERAPNGVLLLVNLHTQDLLDPELYEASSPLTKIADRAVLEITERSTIDDVKRNI